MMTHGVPAHFASVERLERYWIPFAWPYLRKLRYVSLFLVHLRDSFEQTFRAFWQLQDKLEQGGFIGTCQYGPLLAAATTNAHCASVAEGETKTVEGAALSDQRGGAALQRSGDGFGAIGANDAVVASFGLGIGCVQHGQRLAHGALRPQ